jgi:SAM-dependent methyltransferase
VHDTDPDEKQKKGFFRMMTKIGNQMQAKTEIILPPSKTINLQALDICMAPGGYSATVLRYNSHAKVFGLSLPINEGGHEVLPRWQTDKRVKIQFADITMLAAELGFPDLVQGVNLQRSPFSNDIPFKEQKFDLVFCDGQVLRTHVRAQGSKKEAVRLSAAQLIIALRRIKPGGTLVMLLHQAYSPHVIRLLETFDNFSQISLFKSTTTHAFRSSFYLVAKNVDPQSERANHLLQDMRRKWRTYTVLNFGVNLPEDNIEENQETMEDIMESFGERLISLAEPLWKIQKKAMVQRFLKGHS